MVWEISAPVPVVMDLGEGRGCGNTDGTRISTCSAASAGPILGQFIPALIESATSSGRRTLARRQQGVVPIPQIEPGERCEQVRGFAGQAFFLSRAGRNSNEVGQKAPRRLRAWPTSENRWKTVTLAEFFTAPPTRAMIAANRNPAVGAEWPSRPAQGRGFTNVDQTISTALVKRVSN